MTRDARVKCGRCRRYMRRTPTAATPLQRAPRPHDKVCVDCAPVAAGEFKPVSDGQISALHAKCNSLARFSGKSSVDWKIDVKVSAAREFHLPIEHSFRDLTYEQASWCLDWLDEQAYPRA